MLCQFASVEPPDPGVAIENPTVQDQKIWHGFFNSASAEPRLVWAPIPTTVKVLTILLHYTKIRENRFWKATGNQSIREARHLEVRLQIPGTVIRGFLDLGTPSLAEDAAVREGGHGKVPQRYQDCVEGESSYRAGGPA